MKKLKIVIILLLVMGVTYNMAQAENEGLTLKQGIVKPWKAQEIKNLTTITAIRGKPVDSFPKWVNACIDGTIIDAGWAYDMETLNSGALMLGREFGTLGKYLLFLDFPLMNKINISLYFAGLYAEDLFHQIKTQGASGAGYFQAQIKF